MSLFCVGQFDNSDVELAIKWVRNFSSKIREEFEEHYLSLIMDRTSPPSSVLTMFRNHFLNKFPTSETSVERCFSRPKLVHSIMRNRLKPEIVDTMLFVKCNIGFLKISLPMEESARLNANKK